MEDFRQVLKNTDYSIREISEKAGRKKEVIRFDIGQPDHHMPEKAREKASKAIQEENMGYTSLWGWKK